MKKGQINMVPMYVISFVMIGLMVAIGLIVLGKFADVARVETAVSNETVANATTLSLTEVVRVTEVRSNTTKGVIPSADWTLLNNAVYTANTSLLQVDYVYDKNTSASTALTDTTNSVSQITDDWLPILVIVTIVGVLLGLILGAFAFYRRR